MPEACWEEDLKLCESIKSEIFDVSIEYQDESYHPEG
jgi:hypothetical protein